jgi:signal transduction histidine kinase
LLPFAADALVRARMANDMANAEVRGDRPRLDKKRTIVLLRSVVIFTASYLVLFGGHALTAANVACVGLLIASNIALAWGPAWLFTSRHFPAFLLLGDTALVLLGLYRTVGFSQEFLIVYFFTIFLTTAAETLAQIAIGATLVSGLYGYWLWLTTNGAMDETHWLRLPFFFVVAIFYAFLTDELKVERRRRETAEREREHLRLLFEISGTSADAAVAAECINGIGGLIESALPHVRCAVSLNGAAAIGWGIELPIEAYGERFGTVALRSARGRITEDERTLCAVLIRAVANAVYTARQVEGARVASRLKEEFIATLSHELRTPLHAVLGYTDLIESALDHDADPLIAESVGRLRANGRRLSDLIEEMLGFASLRAGYTGLRLEPVDVPRLAGELVIYARELLAGRPVELQVEMSSDLPLVTTDGNKLRQALASLLSNAAKFTEQGWIRLVLGGSADRLVVTVSDTGIGINAADLQHIFDDFRQLDGSSTRRFGGIGLGLALARGLLTLLGGSLEVESQPGHGSTFRATLPCVPSERLKAYIAAPPVSDGSYLAAT